MNDQTSPTADAQGPGSSPSRDPYEEPQSAHGLPGAPDPAPAGSTGSGGPAGSGGSGAPAGPAGQTGYVGPGGYVVSPAAGPGLPRRPRRSFQQILVLCLPDVLAAVVLLFTGAVLGVLSALAWYRFAPTVWLTLPANAVPQVTSNVDQSALLAEPEAKGIASVDGYYFIFTAIVGLLLGIFAFYLARRGLFGDRDSQGNRDGAGVGAWVGLLLGGLAASTLAAALGRWISMPDPLKVLHTIAAGHNFHAPVALHAQGLYLAAPLLGMVLFVALTAAFTKPTPPPWQAYGEEHGYLAVKGSRNYYGPYEGLGQQAPGQDAPVQDARPEGDGSDTAPAADNTAENAATNAVDSSANHTATNAVDNTANSTANNADTSASQADTSRG